MINGTFFLLVVLPAVTLFGTLGIGLISAQVIRAGRPKGAAGVAAPPKTQQRQATGG